MATVEIKYIFDSYEDQDEMELLRKHKDYYNALVELSSYVRNLNKYSDKDEVKIEEVNNKFHEIIEEFHIDLSI